MITTKTVMRAIHDLHQPRAHWPTIADIATYLETSEDEIRPLLNELREERLYKDRRRSNRLVWGPWNPAEFER